MTGKLELKSDDHAWVTEAIGLKANQLMRVLVCCRIRQALRCYLAAGRITP